MEMKPAFPQKALGLTSSAYGGASWRIREGPGSRLCFVHSPPLFLWRPSQGYESMTDTKGCLILVNLKLSNSSTSSTTNLMFCLTFGPNCFWPPTHFLDNKFQDNETKLPQSKPHNKPYVELQNYLMLIIYMIELCTSCVQAHKFSTQPQMLEILCPPMLFFSTRFICYANFLLSFFFQKLKSLKTIFFSNILPLFYFQCLPPCIFLLYR